MILQELKLRNYPYKTRRQLSEKLVHQYFLKKGYEVFRGTRILGHEGSLNYELYPNVKRKYDRLEKILYKKLGLHLWTLRELLGKGIPDFFVHKGNTSFFVEVKLEHESIKKHQLACMKLLTEFGFDSVIIRVKSKPHLLKKIVEVNEDHLETVYVVSKQERLRKKWDFN